MMVAAGWFIVPEFLPLFEQRTPGGTQTTTVAEGFEPGPDLQVQKIDISSLDEAGRLHWRLLADNLEQATPEDESLLTRPELRLRTAKEDASWKFVADGGKVSPDGNTVHLPGEVSGELDTNPSLEFRSSDVRIEIAGGYGKTEAPTMVRRGGFVTRGKGAKFWLDEGRVEFLSEVETTYEAQPRAPSSSAPAEPLPE